MPSVTVQKKRYRHSTMRVRRPLAMLAVATHNQQMSQPLYNLITKVRGPDGQFLLAPTCMTALTACIYLHVYSPQWCGYQ